MEKLDITARIVELIVAIVGSAVITRILTIRQRVRQEKAVTQKAETEVKADQIENIRKTMDEVYKPIIEDLRKTAADAMAEASEARKKADEAMDKVEALEAENRELRRENGQLREAIREINPDLVPSRRGASASSQARGADGRFIKKEDSDDTAGNP